MKRVKIVRDGVVTNQWTDDQLPLGHYEPGFGSEGEYERIIEDVTAEVDRAKANAEAQAYLAATDWYVIREMDEGTPCPPEVKLARAEARARIVR